MAMANPELPDAAPAWTGAGPAEAMLEDLRDGVTVHDAGGRLLYANRAAHRVAVVHPAGELSEGVCVAVRGDDRRPLAPAELPWVRVFDLGGSLEQIVCYAQPPGHACRWFRVSASLIDRDDGPVGGVAVSLWYDITDLREANEALKLQGSVMEAQREASPTGILVLDTEERPLYWNQRFLQFFDIREELLAARSGRAVFSAVSRRLKEPHRFEQMIAQAAQDPDQPRRPVEVVLDDGRTFELLTAPIRGRAGERYGRAWFARDLSDRKRIRASLALRDEFLDVAAHELRTPLTTVLLNAQHTHTQVEKGLAHADAWVHGRLELMVRQLHRLMRLITRLLDATRMTGGTLQLEPQSFDLAQVAEALAAQFAEDAARAGAELSVKAEPTVIRADRGRIEQLLQNLLSNAIKYGAGTPVSLEVRAEPAAAVLSVADRGPGIPAAERPRIFDRYWRSAEARPASPGLGLGLYVAKKIVDAHGGTLAFEDVPGGGARFTARLPFALSSGANGPIVH